MVAPVQKDSLTEWQQGLATYLRITSPIAGMFTGSEIKPNPNARSIRVPDIRVDDYIVDAEIGRIGSDHYSGSEFTSEWKNGVAPIFWREYSMSRHRSFGYTVFDEQLRYSPIKDIVQQYVGRKMKTTVVRDHDKYCLLAAISGHMTGKLVPRVAGVDAIGPVTPDAHRISNTGNAADYKWIAEPGEDYDNQIQPSFATVKGMFLNDADPLTTLDALTLTFSDNWFDSNFGNNERFLLITSALELVFINALIAKGAGTESAFKLYRDGDISGAQANGYLGTLKGSWKLVKLHPEFFPKVYTDAALVVDPVADSSTGGRTLRQVIALAAYKNSIQTYEHFSDQRSQDGGVRFKGTEYVQDFSYDAWAIEQLSEGIVPLFMPTSPTNLAVVNTSFSNVAARVAAGRAQKGVSPEIYPISGADTVLSRPEWYHQVMGYENTTALNAGLPIQEAGDVAHRNPLLPSDDPTPIVSARANTTAYAVGATVTFSNGQKYVATVAGTSAGAQPSTAGIDIGETLADGTVTWRRAN